MDEKKLNLELVRYFLTYKENLFSSAFKFVLFSSGKLRFPNPPSGLAPPPPQTAPAPESNYLLHDSCWQRK